MIHLNLITTLIDKDKTMSKEHNLENNEKALHIGVVTKRWLFWFESEGKEGYTFEIEAKDRNNAYDKAYDSYGPQVAGMMYQVI